MQTPLSNTPITQPPSNQNHLAILAHLGGLFMSFIPALVVYLFVKDRPEDKFVRDQASEALNFQLMFIVVFMLVSMILGTIMFINMFDIVANPHAIQENSAFPFMMIFQVLAMFGLQLCNVVLSILGAVRASKGIAFRYPINLRLIK